jgi:hypothetical protein
MHCERPKSASEYTPLSSTSTIQLDISVYELHELGQVPQRLDDPAKHAPHVGLFHRVCLLILKYQAAIRREIERDDAGRFGGEVRIEAWQKVVV